MLEVVSLKIDLIFSFSKSYFILIVILEDLRLLPGGLLHFAGQSADLETKGLSFVRDDDPGQVRCSAEYIDLAFKLKWSREHPGFGPDILQVGP